MCITDTDDMQQCFSTNLHNVDHDEIKLKLYPLNLYALL